jgi:hypothetical protein
MWIGRKEFEERINEIVNAINLLNEVTEFLIPIINKRQNLIAKYKLIMRY